MKPREKILGLGPESLNDKELLVTIISSGVKGRSVFDIASNLLERFHDLNGVLGASIEDLLEVPGVGPAIASRIVTIGEIIRRLHSVKLPKAEILLVVCDNSRMGILILGNEKEIESIDGLDALPCENVRIYHYHQEEKLPSIADEWFVLSLRNMGYHVMEYKILTSDFSIYDVISKVDIVKGG